MPWTLNASACPSPPTFTGVHDLTAGGTLVAETINAGESSAGLAKINRNATRLDITGRYGGGGYAITEGLAISAGAGLTLNIATGHAMIDGPVQVAAGVTATLTNNIARVWIWLSQAGAIVQVNNSLTPPAGAHVLLGSAVTSAGAITSVDQSGVMLSRGGYLIRKTADVSTPTDVPSTRLIHLHEGASSLWLWDGPSSSYKLLSSGASNWTLATVSITGNHTLSAGDSAANTLLLTDGGVSAIFDLTFPVGVAAGQVWQIRNETGEGARMLYSGGSDYVYLQDGQQCAVFFDSTELRRVDAASYVFGVDWTITGVASYSQWSEIEGDFISLIPSGGSATANWPTAGALDNRGRSQIIENANNGTSNINVRTSGATGDGADHFLLPGEIHAFAINGAGGLVRLPTRAYTRRVAVTMPADAAYTIVHPSFLGDLLEVSSGVALTATRDLILPTCESKQFWIANLSTGAQAIVAKTAAGSGVTIANGSVALVACNGSSYRRLTNDATY